MAQRYRIERDDDGHSFLVEVERSDEFSRLLEQADADQDWLEFERAFSSCRIDGPHRLTFTDPKEE